MNARDEATSMSTSAKILIVDDEEVIRELLSRWLTEDGHDCDSVDSGAAALERLESDSYDLMLLDIEMPGMSGVEVLAAAKESHETLAVIMATGSADPEAGQRCIDLGAHSYLLKPFDEREALLNVATALHERDRSLAEFDQRLYLEGEVRKRTEELRRREEEIALRLVAAAEYRDEESTGHIRRMGMYAEALARALGWHLDDVDLIRVAAPMHDIGKIGVPDGILLKGGRLTPEEFEVVKQHATIGASMLEGSDIPLLRMAEQIARSHHEKWDGSGYPRSLALEDIPVPARIVAVADVFDALTSVRAYRPAFDEETALDMMRTARGTHFDPEIFDVFIDVLPAFRHIKEQITDEPL